MWVDTVLETVERHFPPRLLFGLDRLGSCVGVNHCRKGPLITQRNGVDNVHQKREQESCRRAIPQRRSGEAHRATDIHWILDNVEREAGNTGGHQDPKIIAKESTSDT